jgi:hypothetical protein
MSLNLVQLAADNFQRANENPLSDGGLWIAPVSPNLGLEIVSHLCQSAGPPVYEEVEGQYFNGASLPSDQYASFTIATVVDTNDGLTQGIFTWLRATGLASDPENALPESGYFCDLYFNVSEGVGTLEVSAVNGVSYRELLAIGSLAVSEGDVWTVAMAGSTIYVLQNNILRGSVSDTTFSSGSTFFGLGYVTAAQNLQLSNVAIGFIPTVSGNAGVAGAVVSYSGTASGSVIAGSGGAYSISGLPAGSYTITPSLSGYTFSPTSQNVTITSANLTGINFTAKQAVVSSTRFAFVQRTSTTPGMTAYDVEDGMSGPNTLGYVSGAGNGKRVGQLFWDDIVTQAWSFVLQDNQPYIAAGSADAEDIESFAVALAAPFGVTTVQPGPTPSTRFNFLAVQTRSGQTPLKYLVSDGPSQAYGSVGQIVWDGVFDRWCWMQTNVALAISSPADVACITTFAASLALISPNQISL